MLFLKEIMDFMLFLKEIMDFMLFLKEIMVEFEEKGTYVKIHGGTWALVLFFVCYIWMNFNKNDQLPKFGLIFRKVFC